jgi:hypothetical protein
MPSRDEMRERLTAEMDRHALLMSQWECECGGWRCVEDLPMLETIAAHSAHFTEVIMAAMAPELDRAEQWLQTSAAWRAINTDHAALRIRMERYANEGRNFDPDLADDDASLVERVAADLLGLETTHDPIVQALVTPPVECAGGMTDPIYHGLAYGQCPTCEKFVVLISDGHTIRHWMPVR